MWIVTTPTSAGMQPTHTDATIWQHPKGLWVALVLSVLHQRVRTSASRIPRPTYFLHLGKVGGSQHQVGRLSTHIIRLAAQPARRTIARAARGGDELAQQRLSKVHTPGNPILHGMCLATGSQRSASSQNHCSNSTGFGKCTSQEILPVSQCLPPSPAPPLPTPPSLLHILGAASWLVTGPSNFHAGLPD